MLQSIDLRFEHCVPTCTIAAIGLILSAPLSAAVITDPALLSPEAAHIDFEALAVGAVTNPLVIGDATFSAGPGLGIVNISGYPAHGTEVFGKTLQPVPSGGFSTPYTPITITFSAPASQVILGWFDPNFAGNVLRAFDVNGSLLEQGAVAVGPPGGCCSAWIGFIRPQADIAFVQVVPAATNDIYTIDNVSFLIGVPKPPCPADLNDDGAVDGTDLAIVLGAWATDGDVTGADLSDDGTVDGSDLAIVLGNWGPC